VETHKNGRKQENKHTVFKEIPTPARLVLFQVYIKRE